MAQDYNDVGAKIRIWQTNGVEVLVKDSSALAARSLPVQTTVETVMQGVVRKRRVELWLAPPTLIAGRNYGGYSFMLERIVGRPITNDYIIELRPLMYHVNSSNEKPLTVSSDQDVRLIEFPTIRFKVTPNGAMETVQ